MSLNQKYTWADFIKENPEFKEKGLKRTSSEGKKAFEAAYKAKVKDVLKDRLLFIDKEKNRTEKKRNLLTSAIKETKNKVLRKKIQRKIGSADKYFHNLEKMTTKTKEVQKAF